MSEPAVTTVLFIHGIGNDDPDRNWALALDGALARSGHGSLADRCFDVVAPSWLQALEGPEPDGDEDPPALTYRRTTGADYLRATGRYYERLSELQAALGDAASAGRGPMSTLPADQLAVPVAPRLFRDADEYCKSERRRSECLRVMLDQLPRRGDLVLVGHSLGSVLAADLIYHLPPQLRVRLFLTIGSPLALKRLRNHLRRMHDRPPFERLGPWLNVVGANDPVTAGRGIARFFPEALDVFVQTGAAPPASHEASAYLDQEVVARAFDWLAQEEAERANASLLPDIVMPGVVLRVVAGLQYALRVEQTLSRGDKRTRFSQARGAVAADIARKLKDAGHDQAVASKLAHDNATHLKGRFSPHEATGLLLAACMGNPIAPYEIEFSADEEAKALTKFALDLGFHRVRAEAVLAAEKEARKVQGSARAWTTKAIVAAGVIAVVAAPWMVIAAAPAGLAGGAGIVAGLAALGPGGMVGGLGVVGLVGGAGGAAIAGGLTAGSAANVEENVIYLHALAIAGQRLQEPDDANRVWFTLTEMESSLASERSRLASASDPRARILKELERKHSTVDKALKAMSKDGLGPKEMAP